MRSSDGRVGVTLAWVAPVGLLLALACSGAGQTPRAAAGSAAGGSVACAAAPGTTVSDEDLLALRRTVESGSLYATLKGQAQLRACTVRTDGGRLDLEYTFGDQSWLHVSHDASIEYDSQEARFAVSPAGDPLAILGRVERESQGADGCGIDWHQPPDKTPARDDPSLSDEIFRGDSCNCQARVRRDGTTRVVGLLFRTAC